MKITAVFLGTSCSNPTKDRNLSSVALKYEGSTLLFDAPEGVQRQMMASTVSYMKINHIFLSHLHADHILGIPGLVATMSMHGRTDPLFIYGPRGTREMVKKSLEVGMMRVSFEVVCKEVKAGVVMEAKEFTITAVELKHDVPCFGYVFEEKGKEAEFMRETAIKLGVPVGPKFAQLKAGKSVAVNGKTIKPEQVLDYSKARRGKKVAFIADTRPFSGYYKVIEGADLLIHEASFIEKHITRAKETKHCTAKEAGKVAEKTHCRKLALTHISPRYKKPNDHENEARMEFNDVVVAKDLLEVEV